MDGFRRIPLRHLLPVPGRARPETVAARDRDAGDRILSDQEREVLRHLDSILAHPAWQGTPRRDRFLRYVVTETLAGRGDRLKGTFIAMAVFGRGPGADAQGDAIVRVEARRLRRDLDSHYAGPGRNDPIRISIPKGGYRARFEVGAAKPAGTEAVAELDEPHRGAGPEPLDVSAGPAQPAILVRPFDALGTEPSLQAIADGLTHEVISGLLRFPGLRLHSLDGLPGQGAGTRAFCAERDAGAAISHAVRGAVQVGAEQLKVCVRLVETGDGRVVWSRTFTRPFTARDIIRVQSELAGEIAAALGEPDPGAREGLIARIARSGAPSMESYLAVLAAHAYRRTNLYATYAETRANLEHAVRRDPGYADAWAHLALLRLDGLRFAWRVADGPTDFADVLTAVRRALALDPDNIPAHIAMLLTRQFSGDLQEAQAVGERALRISPHDPDALAALGSMHVVARNDPAGIALTERALARSLTPPPRYHRTLGVHWLMQGDPEAAYRAATTAVADGTFVSAALLAVACAQLGRRDEARAALEAMAQRAHPLVADPVAFFRAYRMHPDVLAVLDAGLRRAGWVPPGSE